MPRKDKAVRASPDVAVPAYWPRQPLQLSPYGLEVFKKYCDPHATAGYSYHHAFIASDSLSEVARKNGLAGTPYQSIVEWIERYFGRSPPGRETVLHAFRTAHGRTPRIGRRMITEALADKRFTKNKGGRPRKNLST